MKNKFRNLLCCVTALIMAISLFPALPASAALTETNVKTYTFDSAPSAYETYAQPKPTYGMTAVWSAMTPLSEYAGSTLEYGATDGADKVLKITGEEYLTTLYRANGTAPYYYYGNVLQQLDFKFTQLSEGAIARFFGWSDAYEGSEEMASGTTKPDSGIMLYGDMLYVRSNFTDVGNDNNFCTTQTYVGTTNIYSTPIVYDRLNANTWYTISRIVDFSQNGNQKQKITVKDRATGEIVGQTDWIQAGIVDQDESKIVFTSPIRTKWFGTGDTIMIDNVKLACISDPGEISYEMVSDETSSGSSFTPSEPLNQNAYNFDTFDLGKNTWYWQSSKELNVTYWPYRVNYGNLAYLADASGDTPSNMSDYNTALSDNGTFRINGDTMIAHKWSRPFSEVEQSKIDVKFNLASRNTGERAALLKLFGYTDAAYGGSSEHLNGYGADQKFEDSGLIFVNGGLYTVGTSTLVTGKTNTMDMITNDDNNNYTNLLSASGYGNQLLAPGTLQNNKWYTVERLVDMNNAFSTSTSTFVIYNQKIKITDKDTGAVVFESQWIPAGYNNNETRTITTSLFAYTKGFTANDIIEFDNYSQTKGTIPEGPQVDDYLSDGASNTNKPGDIRFVAGDAIKTPTKNNIILKKGNDVISDEYYTVTPDEGGKSFVVSFDYLEEKTPYTLTVTGIEDADYGVKYADKTYNFTTGDASAFAPLEITNKSFVTEGGTTVKSFTAGQKVRAAVEIKNDGGDTSNMLIIMAVFDGDRMTAALVCEQTEFSTDTYYTPYYTPATGTETAKILIWDNWDDMKALAPAFLLGETFSE